jgi:PilZ domain-containing protein
MYSKNERRRQPRTKVDRPARVVLPAGTIPCRIKDVSEGGARLETKASSWLPPTFELEDIFSGIRRAAARVWSLHHWVGVRYVRRRS